MKHLKLKSSHPSNQNSWYMNKTSSNLEQDEQLQVQRVMNKTLAEKIKALNQTMEAMQIIDQETYPSNSTARKSTTDKTADLINLSEIQSSDSMLESQATSYRNDSKTTLEICDQIAYYSKTKSILDHGQTALINEWKDVCAGVIMHYQDRIQNQYFSNHESFKKLTKLNEIKDAFQKLNIFKDTALEDVYQLISQLEKISGQNTGLGFKMPSTHTALQEKIQMKSIASESFKKFYREYQTSVDVTR